MNLAIASLTFSVLSFLVIVIGLVLIFYPGMRESLQGVTQGVSSTGSGITDNLKIAGVLGGALSPDIVLLIGFISDLMNLKFRYSVTSLIGIVAVILHWVVGGAIFGFSKSATSAVASAAAAVTSAVTPAATVSGPQVFGVGDPTAPSISPVEAVVEPRVRAPKTTVLGKLQRSRPSRPGSVSTGPDMGTPVATVLAPETRTARFSRVAADASKDKTSKLAANKQLGGAVLPDYITQKFNPCAIRGLGYFDIQGSPMGMAALSSIFMIYLLDMTVGNKRSGAQVGGYVGFSAVVFLLNLYAYRELKCIDTTSTTASLKALALPLAVGLLSGTGGYYVLKSSYAEFLPLDGTHFDDGTGGGQPAKSSNQAHCNAPNEEGQMVCEAYQDGKRITSVPVK